MTSRYRFPPFALVSLAIVVVGFVYWQSDLTSDPPMYYAGLGQSLATDPPQYVFHARNKVLFGDFDPYDYPRWTVYQCSLTSLAGYLVFSLAGVGIRQAGLVGVILSLGALIFIILGLMSHHRPWVAAAVAFCYVINVTLLTHGRLSYLENGLLFAAAMVFFVYCRWGDSLWGTAVAGGLISLAMLAGKAFGALLLPALMLAVLASDGRQRRRRILVGAAAFAVVSVAFILAFYGRDFRAALGYVSEQAYGLRGLPGGLSTPWHFLEYLVSYGFQNRLFYLDADVLLLMLTGLSMFAFHLGGGVRVRSFSPVVIFSACWLLCTFVGLAPLTYSPIRYTLLLIPAVLVFCFSVLDTGLGARRRAPAGFGWVPFIIFVLIFWIALFHVAANLFYFNVRFPPIREMTWLTLPAAVGLALLARWMVTRGVANPGRRAAVIGLILVLAGAAIVNSARIRRLHLLDHNFNILEANEDLRQVLGSEAVVSGPYGPVLTLNNGLRCFVHFFAVADVDSTLFDRLPVTHVAVDPSNWKEALKNYPRLRLLRPLGYYWIRDVEVAIYRISDVFANATAHLYQPTQFERAVAYLQVSQPDSALEAARAFYETYPQSKLGGLLLSDLLRGEGHQEDVYRILSSLAARFATDFNVQLQFGWFVQRLAESRNDANLRYEARRTYQRAAQVNRFKAMYAKELWEETVARYGRPGSSAGP